MKSNKFSYFIIIAFIFSIIKINSDVSSNKNTTDEFKYVVIIDFVQNIYAKLFLNPKAPKQIDYLNKLVDDLKSNHIEPIIGNSKNINIQNPTK